jgi:hypothetical protein
MIGCVMGPAATAPAVVFTPHYTDNPGEGFNDPLKGAQRRTAFEFALGIWETRIPGAMNTNIGVDVSFDPMGGSQFSATLGSGGPTSFEARFSGAPRSDVCYPGALANYLSGVDLNGSSSEIAIQFNSDIDGPVALGNNGWYYGLDGQAHSGDVDFVTVALHELTHSLGFISTGAADGSFGATTSRGTMPDSFDTYLVTATGSQLIGPGQSPYKVTQPVYWSGPQGVKQYQQAFGSTGRPRMYSPSPFEDGSSLSHLDEDKFTGAYDLMTPVASNVIHTPDDIVRGMMADVGWQVGATGDADLSGQVDILDVFALLQHIGSRYGESLYSMPLDVNNDGVVDTSDLVAMASHFGQKGLASGTAASSSLLSGSRVTLPGVQESLVYSAPEPLTAGLMLLGGMVAGLRWRGRYMAGM